MRAGKKQGGGGEHHVGANRVHQPPNKAAPYSTLSQRFIEAVFVQLLAIGVSPILARRECDAMQPLTITVTMPYPNRLSLQANLKDYAWQAEWMMADGESLAAINARLADHIVGINGKLEFPREFVLKRLYSLSDSIIRSPIHDTLRQ